MISKPPISPAMIELLLNQSGLIDPRAIERDFRAGMAPFGGPQGFERACKQAGLMSQQAELMGLLPRPEKSIEAPG
jgi:hypothetical protein